MQDDFTAETDVSKKPNFLLPVSQSAAARKSIFVTPSQDIESACPALKLGKKPFQPVTSKLSVQKFPTPLPMKTVTSDYSKSSKSSKSKNNMVSLSKKVRKEDFPNAPKKPMNAYMIFTEAARRGQ